MAANMKLGDAILYLTGDTKGLDKTLANTGESLKSLGKSLSIMGGAITGAIGVAVKKFADFGDTLFDTSERTGVSAQSLGELSHALQLSGSNLDDFETSMKRFQKVLTDAQGAETKTVDNMEAIGKTSRNLQVASLKMQEMMRSGTANASAILSQRNKIAEYQTELQKLQATHGQVIQGTNESADALKQLGIDYKALQGMKPEDQFMTVAEALSKVDDASRRAAIAQEVFGRSGTRMLPLINEGAAGIAKLRAEVAGTDFNAAADSGDAFNDAMQRLQSSMFALTTTLLVEVVPTITAFIESVIVPATQKLGKFVEQHKWLATALIFLVGGLGLLATALGPPLFLLGSLLSVIGPVATAIGAVVAKVSFLALGLLALKAVIVGAVFVVFYKLGQWLYKITENVQVLRDAFDGLGMGIYGVYEKLMQLMGLGTKSVEVGAKWKTPEEMQAMKAGRESTLQSMRDRRNAEQADIQRQQQAAATGALIGTIGRGIGQRLIGSFASGGIAPGGLALVGERGPELVNLPRGAQVHNAQDTRNALGNVSINVNMSGVTVREQADIGRIARELGRRVDSRLMARGLRPLTA